MGNLFKDTTSKTWHEGIILKWKLKIFGGVLIVLVWLRIGTKVGVL